MKMKKTICLLLAALTLSALISCTDTVQPAPSANPSQTADKTTAEPSMTDPVQNGTESTADTASISAADLAAEIEKVVVPEGTDEFTAVGRLTLKTCAGLKDILAGDGQLTEDFALRYTAGASFDEFGIMCFSSAADAETGKNAALSYIKSKADDALYRSYFPEEEYKLDEGEVRVYGYYVVYAILGRDNRTALFNAVGSLLG